MKSTVLVLTLGKYWFSKSSAFKFHVDRFLIKKNSIVSRPETTSDEGFNSDSVSSSNHNSNSNVSSSNSICDSESDESNESDEDERDTEMDDWSVCLQFNTVF